MTTFEIRNQTEYAAEVVRVERLVELEGLDNLVGLAVNGYTALVSRSTQVGDVLVVFPAEAQLSHEFVRANNLYSDGSQNEDPTAKGYLGKNRRVRAIRLRGHTSSALALQASVFGNPAPGTRFDTVDGIEVSRKYELPVKAAGLSGKSAQGKVWKRVDTKYLPEHIDTANYWRNRDSISPDTIVTVSQKLHGTSIRLARTIVKREPTFLERMLVRLGIAEYV